MTRIKRGVVARQKHKKILKMAKGYRGRAKNCFRVAKEKVEKAMQYSYRDRRNRKRDFRRLWIQRINAAVRAYGLTYSQFISKLKSSGNNMNRKMLAELAIREAESFKELVRKTCA